MPSKEILPTQRREALEALIDEAVANVKSTLDVSQLHDCRTLFRKKVPLALRAYVTAALLLRATEKTQNNGRQRNFEQAERGNRPKQAAREEPRQAPREKQAQKPKQQQAAPQKQQSSESDAEQKSRIRENRFQGEGITLFISAGRRQRFYARVALKMISDIEGVDESAIGDIRTMDNYSFIILDPAVEDMVISALNGTSFKGRELAVNRARKRDEAELPISGAETLPSSFDEDEEDSHDEFEDTDKL